VCAGLLVCSAGSCSCAASGTAQCGLACINVDSDPNNCGTCGNVCPKSCDPTTGICNPAGYCQFGLCH
jgi:hypothetical protein